MRSEQAGQEQENGRYQQNDADAVKTIPLCTVGSPATIGMFRIHRGDSVVDGDKHRYGEQDDCHPEDSR